MLYPFHVFNYSSVHLAVRICFSNQPTNLHLHPSIFTPLLFFVIHLCIGSHSRLFCSGLRHADLASSIPKVPIATSFLPGLTIPFCMRVSLDARPFYRFQVPMCATKKMLIQLRPSAFSAFENIEIPFPTTPIESILDRKTKKHKHLGIESLERWIRPQRVSCHCHLNQVCCSLSKRRGLIRAIEIR